MTGASARHYPTLRSGAAYDVPTRVASAIGQCQPFSTAHPKPPVRFPPMPAVPADLGQCLLLTQVSGRSASGGPSRFAAQSDAQRRISHPRPQPFVNSWRQLPCARRGRSARLLCFSRADIQLAPRGPKRPGAIVCAHSFKRIRLGPSADHHFSTHGRSTTSNAQVDRCCRCNCR